MPNYHFLIEQEKAQRDAVVAWLETFPILGKIFPRRRLITNRADFVKKAAVKAGAADGLRNEVRYVFLEFLRFEDSDSEGFDDCPVPIISYNLHLFQEFADVRSDDTNSTDDFISSILTLRDGVLYRRNFDFGKADPIEQDEFAQFGNDGLTDCEGHFTDLTLKVSNYANQ